MVTSWVSRNAGGLFQSVRSLSQTLVRRPEVSVRVFGLCDEYSEADAPAWRPLVPRTFQCLGPRQFGFSPALIRALREDDCDLVHTHGIWMAHSMAPLFWHRRTGRPHLISPRAMLHPEILHTSHWKKRLASWLYESQHLQRAACLHALCRSEAESMRAYGLTNPICIIPNGIAAPALSVAQLAALECPLKGPKASGRKVLLYLGRIHPRKGLTTLLKAWHALGPRRMEWILALAGWEQVGFETQLKELATQMGLLWLDLRNHNSHGVQSSATISNAVSVLFLGPRFGDDKAACFWNSDACILPSLAEGMPMSILEAWSYGKPVVITPDCNIPEGVEEGAALGIEAEPQSTRAGLELLFTMSDAERQEMGKRGLKLITDRFAWPKIARDMHTVYQWVLGGGPKPDSVELR